jgi:hypothetical protein
MTCGAMRGAWRQFNHESLTDEGSHERAERRFGTPSRPSIPPNRYNCARVRIEKELEATLLQRKDAPD